MTTRCLLPTANRRRDQAHVRPCKGSHVRVFLPRIFFVICDREISVGEEKKTCGSPTARNSARRGGGEFSGKMRLKGAFASANFRRSRLVCLAMPNGAYTIMATSSVSSPLDFLPLPFFVSADDSIRMFDGRGGGGKGIGGGDQRRVGRGKKHFSLRPAAPIW